MARPALKRQAVTYIVDHYSVARRRACRIIRQHRSVQYYQSCKDPRTALRARMRELAQVRMRYGYRRLHVLLRREGWVLGRELAYRLYTEESLQLRSKRPRRRKMVVARREPYVPKRANQAWSMDFVVDQLADGRIPGSPSFLGGLKLTIPSSLEPSYWSKRCAYSWPSQSTKTLTRGDNCRR
jgi:putative transposase